MPLTGVVQQEWRRARIAAITLANEATLLSRNRKDFEKIPDLKVENWLD
ncbi:MAG: hypothetical protein HZA46_07695 [Planctomycetales bacterium]|nr:hypothetical protein [Planctomycetales bacterium]